MGLNAAANDQIEQGQRDKEFFDNKIKNFKYTNSKFSEGLTNPFADTTNPFANVNNPFAGQQVALKAADYQRQGTDQQLANTLDTVVQQAGGNAAASATAIARQSAKANQQIGAGIEQQESKLQQQTAQGELQRQQLVAQGEQRRQQLVGQGQQFITGLTEQRAGQALQGLGNRFAAAQQTINSGYQSKAATNAALIGAVGSLAGGFLGGAGAAARGGSTLFAGFCDHRLKENIKFKRFSPSGIGVYKFNYKGHPEHKFEGPLSIAVPKEAVIKNYKGTKFDGVDFTKLDVSIKKIN